MTRVQQKVDDRGCRAGVAGRGVRREARHRRAGESGQAVVEFGFIVLCTAMFMLLLFTLFLFAEDIFRETSRVRSETFKSFHDDKQFEVAGGKVYRPRSPITVNVRRLGMISSFIGSPPPYRGNMMMTGGTKAPWGWWISEPVQCGLGTLAVLKFTQSKHRFPGHTVGAIAGLALCTASLIDDWAGW